MISCFSPGDPARNIVVLSFASRRALLALPETRGLELESILAEKSGGATG